MKINGMVAICAMSPRVAWRVPWRAATCAISCDMTPASSASVSAFRISPEFTKKKPPGKANAFTSSESSTLMVKGTLASEFRTRFCPTRLTYSATIGSSTILACRSVLDRGRAGLPRLRRRDVDAAGSGFCQPPGQRDDDRTWHDRTDRDLHEPHQHDHQPGPRHCDDGRGARCGRRAHRLGHIARAILPECPLGHVAKRHGQGASV